MCKFELTGKTPVRHCKIAGYFESAPKVTQPGHNQLVFPALPLDDQGYCIFHSRDIDWKLKNKFHKWLDHLISYLLWLDRTPFMASFPPVIKEVDLCGVLLIGKEVKLTSGAKETVLKFKNLNLSDHIEFKLDEAEIADKTVFESCNIASTVLSFNHTIFNSELYFSNCSTSQMSFNDARLNGGLLMRNCELGGYAEFGGMRVNNILQINGTHFQTHAYFTSCNLRCESVFIENVHFQGRTDFGLCTFHGDVEFQECRFEELLNFSNARFNGPVIFTGNYYEENVQFTSSEPSNKVFYDTVNFIFIDKESEVQQRLVFDNVNFYLISGKDRGELNELARLNKVTIGSGCIKHRVQTTPVTLETNDINKNIAKELAQSFTNYFTSSTGKNLGVEFLDNTINRITLFYFTDEDITEKEFVNRLKSAEKAYWASGEPGVNDQSPEETQLKIDNYVGKIAVLIKMAMLQEQNLISGDGIEQIVKALNFTNESERAKEIQININHYLNMKIGKIIAQPNSQVNIAENIKKIEFKPSVNGISEQDIEQIKALLLLLNTNEVQELQKEMEIIPQETKEYSASEMISIKLNDLAVRHGLPIIDGIAASALFELLKNVFKQC